MFFFQKNQSNEEKTWKTRQSQYHKESSKKDRQNKLQNQRFLNFIEVIDWRMSIQSFKNKVDTIYNYYTLLNTLFAISQEVNWREYIEHMILLVSSFHNMMYNKKSAMTNDIAKINNFQKSFKKLFLLKDLTLHQHLMLLLKLLLGFNCKYEFMRQTTFSEILAQSAIYNDTDAASQVLWTIAQIEVSSSALIKLIKQESLTYAIEKSENCLLPLLTIIANFISNLNENYQVVEQLVTSTVFQKAFQLGLFSNRIQIVNETVLIFNNGLCFSPHVRGILLKQEKIIQMILSLQCPERQKSQQILTLLGLSYQSLTGKKC